MRLALRPAKGPLGQWGRALARRSTAADWDPRHGPASCHLLFWNMGALRLSYLNGLSDLPPLILQPRSNSAAVRGLEGLERRLASSKSSPHEEKGSVLTDDFTHVDSVTGRPTMVDVGNKTVTTREAVAMSVVHLPDKVMELIGGDGEMQSKKGPVFATAIIAGTMAAKRTHDLIPFCHPLPMESCKIKIEVAGDNEVEIECTVRVSGKTGVEMEALTGASVAALAVYDMCKGVSHDIEIRQTRLLKKTGGKSDFLHSRK